MWIRKIKQVDRTIIYWINKKKRKTSWRSVIDVT